METGATEGQSAAEPTGTIATGTEGQAKGESVAPVQTTASGTGAGGEESFFDPESIKGKPELEAAYKSMQSAFSKKTLAYKAGADKVRQYDEFMTNPLESAKRILQQMGHQVVQGPQDGNQEAPEFKSWDDVMSEAKRQVMDELKPMFGEMQDLKQQNVEQFLDNNHSDWRTYEEPMLANLQAHPTFVKDPSLLYRMSVPEEVMEARATKRAMQKLQGTTEGSQIQGQSTTTVQSATKPSGPLTFNQSVDVARKQLAERGMRSPAV